MSKILFIIHYPPPIHGAAMMGQYIKESSVINQSIDGRYINLSTSNSVDDIGKHGVKKVFRFFKTLYKVVSQSKSFKPDLVYITLTSHGLGLIKDSMIVLVCRFFNLPHVYHFHNKGVNQFAQTVTGRILYPFIFKKGKVILLSPLLYSDISSFIPPHRVFYCANGIPKLKQQAKNISAFDTQPIRLFLLSNLIRSKGILHMIEACQLLKNDGVNFHLTIAGGEGDISVEFLSRSITNFELVDFVSYKGKVQGKEKDELFVEADVFILPTEDDCFPLVLLEAMQCGLPIISTKIGAIPEIIDDGVNGILVDAKSSHAIAQAVIYLKENPEKIDEFGRASRQKFDKEYTLEHFENRFLQVLDEVMLS